jgi:hypothetical protein
MDLGKAKTLFPAVACKLELPNRPIPMVIGMDHMKNAPRKQKREDGVMLYQSEFNTGYMACGDMNQGSTAGMQKDLMLRVLRCRSSLFNPPEFIPAEAMGTELPGRCPACKNCKECQFLMDSLSFKESTEYEIILNTMEERLIDNYNQARGYMGKMEVRLIRTEWLGEFNRQFQAMWTEECLEHSLEKRQKNIRTR